LEKPNFPFDFGDMMINNSNVRSRCDNRQELKRICFSPFRPRNSRSLTLEVCHPERAFILPTANPVKAGAWSLPQREITIKRLKNTLVGLKTGRVKNSMTLCLRNYHGCCESYPRQWVIGFGWLPVCRETLKTHTLVRKK